MRSLLLLLLVAVCSPAFSQSSALREKINKAAASIEQKVIAWRRDIHQHPELGNHEDRTASIITKHLQSLGIEVKTGVAHTGVVGILKGGKPGPVVALRADMDALPITERVPLPFASTVKTQYNGQEVGVMHACGHDSHVAMLMGVAEVLASMKSELKGTVKFIFQPAEEGVPRGEEGGAEMMVKEGALLDPPVDAIFGLHIKSAMEAGKIYYCSGGIYAGVNDMKIIVRGKGSHGAYPWKGIDPIVVSAEIINNLQTIVSRSVDISKNAAVVTIGAIHGGVRFNIIPEEVEMMGTVRAFTDNDEKLIVERIRQVATKTAESAGATAEVIIPYSSHYPVTYNNIELTEKMVPSLEATVGKGNLVLQKGETGAEDFSFFQQKVPGMFINLGGMPKGNDPDKAPPHHTPDFFIDESSFIIGVKALANLVTDYMEMNTTPAKKH